MFKMPPVVELVVIPLTSNGPPFFLPKYCYLQRLNKNLLSIVRLSLEISEKEYACTLNIPYTTSCGPLASF